MSDRASPTTDPTKRRTSGSQKRQRGKRVILFTDEAERAEIEARAERSGLSVSGFLRASVFGKDARQPSAAKRPPVEKETLLRLLAELGKVGSNINQIARRVNQDKGFDAPIFATLYAELKAVNQAILQALGKEAKP